MRLEILKSNGIIGHRVTKENYDLMGEADGLIFLDKALFDALKPYNVIQESTVKKSNSVNYDSILTINKTSFWCHADEVTVCGKKYILCCLVDSDMYRYLNGFYTYVHYHGEKANKERADFDVFVRKEKIKRRNRNNAEPNQKIRIGLIKCFMNTYSNFKGVEDLVWIRGLEPHHKLAPWDNRSWAVIPLTQKEHDEIHSRDGGYRHRLDVIINTYEELIEFINFANSQEYVDIYEKRNMANRKKYNRRK